MIPNRLSVKLLIQNAEDVDLKQFVPIFQRWIQQHTVEGMLIDVADYKHVPNGPGVILISHEGDYALSMTNGQPGVSYTYKQIAEDTLEGVLSTAFRRVTQAVNALADESLNLDVDTSSVQVTFVDRLNFPSGGDLLEDVSVSVQSAVDSFYGGGAFTVIQTDPRLPLTLQVTAEGVVT